MNNYRFRSNWRGKLILQRLIKYRDQWGGPDFEWCDADAGDLKDYYAELCKIQNTPTCQELRRLFDAESG
jgi:hypothetical protein